MSAVLVWALRDLAILIAYSVLLAYALLPVVNALERLPGRRGQPWPRGVVAAAVMIALVALTGWVLWLVSPRVASEAMHFAAQAPEILARLGRQLRAFAAVHGLTATFEPWIARLDSDGPALLRELTSGLTLRASTLLGGLDDVLGLALLPLLAFYLLAESEAVRRSALTFVTRDAQDDVVRMGGAVDRALRSYVRGQAIVCVLTGALVGIALAFVHHPAVLLLALVVALAELIPYLGFMVAASAIAFAGSGVGSWQALLGVGLYVVLNWSIGTFVTPRVMGRYLRMHPFVVTVSVLAGAKLLGPAGALLALPGAAVLQSLIGELVTPPPRRESVPGPPE